MSSYSGATVDRNISTDIARRAVRPSFLFACMWVMTIVHRGLKVKVVGEGQMSIHKNCVLHKCLSASYEY